MHVIQEYSTEDIDWYGYNMFISDDICKIKIHLGSLMDRKNMAFKKIWKKINSYFLLEFTCALLRDEGLWDENLCGDGYNCNIKNCLKKINYFLW